MKMLAFVALALGLGAAPAPAARPLALVAPEFNAGSAWINSKPLLLDQFKKRSVVVIGFVSISSARAVRSLLQLQSWANRYSNGGLVVIGVHTPDFEFEKNAEFVTAELRRLGIAFPVVLDNDRRLWNAYQVQGWPTQFIIDGKGRIVFDRLGEGRAQEFEEEIIAALQRLHTFHRYPLHGYWPPVDPDPNSCGQSTPAISLGLGRGRSIAWKPENNRFIIASRDGEVAYDGVWVKDAEGLRLKRVSKKSPAWIHLIYRGASSMALAQALGKNPIRKPIRVFLKQDDHWLDPQDAGSDVRFDKSLRSYVDVSMPRLYSLTLNPNDQLHQLTLAPEKASLQLYGFDFTNACDRSGR